MGILLGVSGFRVSALNRVCPSVRPTCDWTEGRKRGEFSLSLINTNEEVSSLSLTHKHTQDTQSLTHSPTFIYMCKWVYSLVKPENYNSFDVLCPLGKKTILCGYLCLGSSRFFVQTCWFWFLHDVLRT
jgi:hypothetical protein